MLESIQDETGRFRIKIKKVIDEMNKDDEVGDSETVTDETPGLDGKIKSVVRMMGMERARRVLRSCE